MHEWDRSHGPEYAAGRADRRLHAASALDAQATAQHGSRLAAGRARRGAGARRCRIAGRPVIARRRDMGVACGSSIGSTADITDFAAMMLLSDGTRPERELVRAHDAAHHRGQHRHLLRRSRAASFRPRAPARRGSQGIGYAYEAIKFGRQDADARRRRRRAVPDRSDGVRHAVRDQPAQRSAAHHAASLRSRSRRPGGRRRRRRCWCSKSSSTRSARCAHSRRARRLRQQLRRRARHQARKKTPCARCMELALADAGLRPRPSAT